MMSNLVPSGNKQLAVRLAIYALFAIIAFKILRTLAAKLLPSVFGPLPPGPDEAPPPPIVEQGQEPTLSTFQLAAIADALDNELNLTLWTTDATVVDLLKKPHNDADVYGLVKAYGQRRGRLWTGPFSLPARVSDQLDTSDIAEVNGDYSAKGIGFTF